MRLIAEAEAEVATPERTYSSFERAEALIATAQDRWPTAGAVTAAAERIRAAHIATATDVNDLVLARSLVPSSSIPPHSPLFKSVRNLVTAEERRARQRRNEKTHQASFDRQRLPHRTRYCGDWRTQPDCG